MDADNKNLNRNPSNNLGMESPDVVGDDSEGDLTDEQQTIRERRIAQLRPYQYKKGQTGNSLGRYLGGISGKERMRRKIAGMTDDEFEDFIEGMTKKDLFEMAEGKPDTKGDLKIEVPNNLIELIRHGTANQTGDNKLPE